MSDLLCDIQVAFKEKKYQKAVYLIERYLDTPNAGVYAHLLNLYVFSCAKIGDYGKASKYLKIMIKLFPGYLDGAKLAILYSSCHLEKELESYVDTKNFTRGEYYNIAKECFYNGQYALARKYFSKSIDERLNDHVTVQAKGFLQRIGDYVKNQDNPYGEDYEAFKKMGNVLEPGHVVYVDCLDEQYKQNQNNTDPKKSRRPYMIWKVTNPVIYAFPITRAKCEQARYVLYAQNYPETPFDRVIKDRLVAFTEKDVNKVISKIHRKDYEILLSNMYQLLCYKRNESKSNIRIFIDDMREKIAIKKDDILVTRDENGQKASYFVLHVDKAKKNYNCIRVIAKDGENYEVIQDDARTISMDANILYRIPLEKKQIMEIRKNIPDNYQKKSILGNIVEVEGRKLQIMLDREDYYLCVDRGIPGPISYMFIQFLRKDIPLNVTQFVDQDEYKRDLFDLYNEMKKYPRQINAIETEFARSLKH